MIGSTIIKRAVCSEFDINPVAMVTPRKMRVLARPRQIAMYLCRELDGRSFGEIGMQFGRRDHTTVLRAHRTVAHLIESDPDWRERVHRIRGKLEALRTPDDFLTAIDQGSLPQTLSTKELTCQNSSP